MKSSTVFKKAHNTMYQIFSKILGKFLKIKQSWCGKNRVVFTGFYQQINPRSGKYWEI
jgi:hypothetical protein